MRRNPDQLRTSKHGEPFTEEQLRGPIGDEKKLYVDVVKCTFEPGPLFSRVDHSAIGQSTASSLVMLRDYFTSWFPGSRSDGKGHSPDDLPPVDNSIPDSHDPVSSACQESNPLMGQGLSRFSSPNSLSTLSRRRVSPCNRVEVA